MAHRGRPGNLYMHGKDLLANMEVCIYKWSDPQFTPPCPDRSGDSAQECDRERFSQRGQHGSAGKPALAQHVHSLTSVSANLFGYGDEASARSSEINLIQSNISPSVHLPPSSMFWSVVRWMRGNAAVTVRHPRTSGLTVLRPPIHLAASCSSFPAHSKPTVPSHVHSKPTASPHDAQLETALPALLPTLDW